MKKLLAVLLLAVACATTHPPVVRDFAEYDRQVAADPDKRLVEITDIRRDVRYATTNNFMHAQLYPVPKVYLRRPAAIALHEIERELAREGLGLKIFDGYRPYRVTVRMWKPIRNPDFVADPAKGSRHNRGAAVDLTLIDLRTGRELPMPTPYDDFTPRARQDFNDLSPEVIANRAKLRNVMESHGFAALPSEWWHFDFRGWERFELLDLALEKM
jgi:D-alanyl-D-alanine dipeptidase